MLTARAMFLASGLLGYWTVPAAAYSNYEDCLLERMENQPANMATVVIVKCGEEFPLVRPVAGATREQIFNWALEKTSREIQAEQMRGEPVR